MSSYAANRQQADRIPWFGILGVLALFTGIILFFALVVIPWSQRQDARDTLHAQQRLTVLRKLGFVHVSDKDFYTSSYYNGPTAFTYPVGTCSIEIIIDGSGANSRPYIWLKSVEDTRLFVTYNQLKHIPQTAACFSR